MKEEKMRVEIEFDIDEDEFQGLSRHAEFRRILRIIDEQIEKFMLKASVNYEAGFDLKTWHDGEDDMTRIGTVKITT